MCGRCFRLPRLAYSLVALLLTSSISYAQFTNVTNNTSAPVAGTGGCVPKAVEKRVSHFS